MSIIEDKRSRPHFDFTLLIITYLLMIIGVLSISVANFDPSVSGDMPLLNRILASSTGSWQAIFVIASPAAVWFIVSIPYDHFKTFSAVYYMGTLAFLMVVLVTSSAIRDVKAWFEVALGRMLQPSEFVKITIILMLAKEFASNVKPLSTLRSVIRLGLIVMLPAGITYLSGETGSVIIMLGIAFTMLFFSDVDWKWLVVVGVIALLGIAAFFAYAIIGGGESYIFYRIRAFIDPHAYTQGAGLQLLRSQQAIGSGGMTGVGLFVPGSMSQLNFVPEDWTDFVFATVGEAVGFIGTTVIVLLFLFLILRMLYLSRFTYDKFGRQIIVGVMALMFLHVFQNIAMTIGLMPITGIPLPFISYGGSNLLTNVIGISLVLNVTKNRRQTVSKYELPAGSTIRKRRRKRASIFVNMTQQDRLRGFRRRRLKDKAPTA